MSDTVYEFAPSRRSGRRSYRLAGDMFVWPGGSVPVGDIRAIRVYTVPGARSFAYGMLAQPSRRCTIRLRDGRKIVLSSLDYLSINNFADRSELYLPFVRALIRSAARAAPGIRLLRGMPPVLWSFWLLMMGVPAALLGLFALAALIAVLVGQVRWTGLGIALAAGFGAFGPLSFLPGIWRRRPRPLDDADGVP